MLRGYRDQLIFAVTILGCFLVVGLWGQDPPKGTPAVATLKPGDEVKPLELEAAKLGKLKAQLAVSQVQQALLQQQYNQLLAEAGRTQAKIDALAKEVEVRVKKEKNLDITYDQSAGEDGIFRIEIPPSVPSDVKTPTPDQKKKNQ
jgi:hypothetical protein